MMYDIPLPRLLDANMQEVRRLRPIFCGVTQTLKPLSTASMELQKGEIVPARSFVEMYTSAGSAGIYRSRAPQKGFGDQTDSVELEHAVCEIGDYLVKEEIEEETTARAAIIKLFSHYGGSLWQLGTISPTDTVTLTADYDNVLEAILALMDQIPGYMITFDQSSLPWKLNVVARPQTVTAEGRLSRNIQSVRITEDDSDLCTRVYIEELPNGYMDADTISTYGVVERQITSSGDITEAQAQRMASLYLQKHKKPALSVDIDAQDLAAVTGETLDKFEIGKRFRLAIPEYNVTVEEIITALNWSNVYDEPGAVTVTLAEQDETLLTFLHKQDVTGGRSGGAGRKRQEKIVKEFETAISQTDYEISLRAYQRDLEHTDENLLLAYAAIGISSNQIDSIVTGSGVTLGPDGKIVTDANGLPVFSSGSTQMWSKIQQNANNITLKVSKGDVATQLAVEAGNVTISGGNLVVSGYVTATQLGTVNQRVSDIIAGDISFSNCVGTRGSFNSIYLSGSQLTRISRVIDGVSTNIVGWYG